MAESIDIRELNERIDTRFIPGALNVIFVSSVITVRNRGVIISIDFVHLS